MRKGEEHRMSGIAFYLIGSSLSVLVFPREFAVLAILYLAMGDPIAAIFGLKHGKHVLSEALDIPHKTLEGSLACLTVCSIATFLISFSLPLFLELDLQNRILLAFLGGVSATVGEAIPLRTDDNLSMPLISGALLWLLASTLNLVPGLYSTF